MANPSPDDAARLWREYLGAKLGVAPLDGTVRVDLGGDGEAAVEREVALEAEAGATRELRLLNRKLTEASKKTGFLAKLFGKK